MAERNAREGTNPSQNRGETANRGNFQRSGTMEERGGEAGVMGAVADKARDVAQGAADMAGQAYDKAREWVGTAADKTQEWAGEAYDKAQEWAGDVSNLIRRYPIQSLLVGFGVGILMGRLMRS